MNKQEIINYLIEDGYNDKLLLTLNNKELYRIFILTLAINSNFIK